MCLAGNPHRRFLVWGLLVGVMLVGFGYARDLPGFFADGRMHSLDFALAPFRNVHKFDVVLRIPLILGLAYALTELPKLIRTLGSVVALRVYRVAVGAGRLRPAHALAVRRDRGERRSAAGPGVLEPGRRPTSPSTTTARWPWSCRRRRSASTPGATSTTTSSRGWPRSPWAVRNVVPLAQPGNVVFLDAVTRVVESGRPQPQLASYLAANGVGTLVVRNDLDRLLTGAPDPAYVKAVLSATPGLTLVRSFGHAGRCRALRLRREPRSTPGSSRTTGSPTVAQSIDVYQVRDPSAAAVTTPGEVLLGDPSSPLDPAMADVARRRRCRCRAPTRRRGREVTGQVLTDDLKRREMNFPAVRWNESGHDDRRRAVPARRARSSRTGSSRTTPGGTRSRPGPVASSERRGQLVPGLCRRHAAAGDRRPPGRRLRQRPEHGVGLGARPRPQAAVVAGRLHRRPHRLARRGHGRPRLRAADVRCGSRAAGSPARCPLRGPATTARTPWACPTTTSLRITPVYDGPLLTGSVALSEVQIDDLHPQRYLRLPAPLDRRPGRRRSPCRATPTASRASQVRTAFACDPLLREPGEDGDILARQLTLPDRDPLRRRGDGLPPPYATRSGPRCSAAPAYAVTVPRQRDGRPGRGPGALVDGDPSTTWVATAAHPGVQLTLPHRTTAVAARLDLEPGRAGLAAASASCSAPGAATAVVDVDRERAGARAAALAGPPPRRARRVDVPGVHSRRPAVHRARARHLRAQAQRARADPQRLHHA